MPIPGDLATPPPYYRDVQMPNQAHELEKEVVVGSWSGKLGELILKIVHFVSTPFRILFYPLRILFPQNKSKTLGEYCFTQQYNDSCHLSPLKNLQILETIRQNGYDSSQLDFRSRREWLGENQKMLTIWHSLIGQVCQPGAEQKFPEFHKYIIESLNTAPVFPHFYDEKHKNPFHGLSGVLEFGELPFFLIDIESVKDVRFRICMKEISFDERVSMDDLGLKTGFVKEKGEYKLYNLKTKTFDLLKDLTWVEAEEKTLADGKKETHIRIKWDLLPSDIASNYPLPPSQYTVIMRDIDGLGFEQIGVVNELGGGLKIQDKNGETHTYIPFQMSLLKLLLLASGIGSDNEQLKPGDSLYPVSQELRSMMAQHPDNLWHPNNIKAEMLLQYQIANLFKQDPALFEQASHVVDALLTGYKNYNHMLDGKFYNKDGIQLKGADMEKYLLGKEQMVAYFLMQNIRTAWYSSINPSIPIHSLELGLPSKVGKAMHLYIKRCLSRKVNIKLQDGNTTKKSFLDVWETIRKKLEANVTGRTDFMSFDHHGWVVSLDPEIIKLQDSSKTIYDRKFLKRLGIAGIESWWGSELNLWYKKIAKKVAPIHPSAPSKLPHAQKV